MGLNRRTKFICWRLNPHVTLFGDRAYKVIIIKWDHRVGLKFDRIGVLLRKGRNTRVPSFWKHQEIVKGHSEKVLSASWEERSHQKQTLLTPRSWPCNLRTVRGKKNLLFKSLSLDHGSPSRLMHMGMHWCIQNNACLDLHLEDIFILISISSDPQ